MLILDYVVSPRVSRNPNDTEEEAFGFEAREYLRKFLNGAVVRCVWNPDKGRIKKRGKGANLNAALKELHPAPGPNGNLRLARVFGELQCLRDNPKQRYSEAVYKDSKNWVDVASLMCSNGWARTKRIMKEDERHPTWHQCKSAEDAARERHLGQHTVLRPADIRKHTRNLDWQPSVEQLYEQFKNKPIKGIVEDVREGSTIRCEIYMPTDDTEIVSNMLWVCLSGIQAERMPKPVKTQKMEHDERVRRGGEKAGKFKVLRASKNAEEAKVHVERRLLHQDVTITLQNYSKTENKVWGTITLGPHDIASYLLRQGLAWMEGWSMADENRERYLKDEQMAQQQQKGRWAAEAPAKRKKRAVSQSEWMVTQVYNADCVWLSSGKQNADGTEIPGKRAYLAHIKAPRENRQPGSGASEVYAWEAKEFVRKNLIGKPISVKVIYTKQFAPRANEKVAPTTEFVSITYDGKDIAMELVKQGLARVIRTNEMTRAENYFQLAEANEAAVQKGVGVHGDDSKYKEPKREDLTLPKMSNAQKRENKKTEILQKSRSVMSRLGLKDNIDLGTREYGKRDDKIRKTSQAIPAVVEYVFGATRMKVRIKVDNQMYLVILFLGGIRGLRGADLNEKQRKIQKNADEWVRQKVQQQENIYVMIESLDKNSNFVGHVFVGSGKGAKNLSVKLLEEGWVEVFANAARRSPYGKLLHTTEDNAKEAQIGMWEGWVEDEHTEENKGDPTRSNRASREPQKHRMEGKKNKANVTYVESANELFIVLTGEPQFDSKNKEVNNYMGTVNPSVNHIQANSSFKPGDFVAGLFSGAYYRCRISSIRNKDSIHNVRFIDFGNRGSLQEAEILPLEKYDKNGKVIAGSVMKTIEPLARRCRLAGLKPPPEKSTDYCNAAGTFFANHAYGEVEVEVLAVSRRAKTEIYDVELRKDGVNLNEMMAEQGWCRVDDRAYNMWGGGRDKRKPKFPERLERLRKLQKEAIEKHHGMYQYGLVDSEDEND